MIFYVGLHQPSDGRHFERACISVNRLERRISPVRCKIMLDSGAFTELLNHGRYRSSVREYAAKIRRLWSKADIEIAVAQDYMCEPIMLARTGLTIEDHQRLTISRYDALMAERVLVPIMPVLQGYSPQDYVRHVDMYGRRLKHGAWVGVGSVCKRQGDPAQIIAVLSAIRTVRPDLRLHGFGVKKTSLKSPEIRAMLYSADSMAWSYAARKQGRSSNDWREAATFLAEVSACA